jgi:hypothetical protein
VGQNFRIILHFRYIFVIFLEFATPWVNMAPPLVPCRRWIRHLRSLFSDLPLPKEVFHYLLDPERFTSKAKRK